MKPAKTDKKIILIDMDGVLADAEASFLAEYRKKFPNHFYLPIEEKAFYIGHDYPPELKNDVHSIYQAEGFFLNLPLIPGAKEALEEMLAMGHDVRIATSPLLRYKHCVLEKYKWVHNNLGFEWTRRIILSKDKTLIHGDVLIDDKPEHEGERIPSWEHILYDAPYNRHLNNKKRLTWDNWNEVLEL